MDKIQNKEEINATIAALPRNPSLEGKEHCEERLKEYNVLIYKVGWIFAPLEDRNVKCVKAFCTSCEQEFALEYEETREDCHIAGAKAIGFVHPETQNIINSYTYCDCPWCGSRVYALHVSEIRYEYEIEHTWVGEIYNIRGHLALLSWYVTKSCTKDGTVRYTSHLSEGVLIINGNPIRVAGYRNNFGRICWLGNWQRHAKYTASFGKWQRDQLLYNPNTIDETEAEKCGLHQFIQSAGKDMNIGAYLWLWTKCPQIENLVTSGNTDFVVEMINAMTYDGGYYSYYDIFKIGKLKRYINTKKVKPHEMMRCEKKEISNWRAWGLERFAFWGYVFEKYGIKLDKNRLEQCYNEGLNQWYNILANRKFFLPPLQKTFNYLDRQKRSYLEKCHLSKKNMKEQLREDFDNLSRYGNYQTPITPQYLCDYWNMLYSVYNGFPEELKYPKNLVKAHDRMITLVKFKEDERLKQKFVKRAEELSVLSYTNKKLGLFIRACATQNEMIVEGKALSHCVGTYANSHANGKTSIFFIRKISDPDKPYFTLEWRDGLVQQNLGYKNRDPNTDIVEFVKRWVKYINRKVLTNGKQRNEHNKERAGA